VHRIRDLITGQIRVALKYPEAMVVSRGSIYAWYSQMTRMMVPASSGVRPKIGGCGYFRSR